MEQNANKEQKAETLNEVAKGVLAEHNQCRSLSFYKALLEKLKAFMSEDVANLSDKSKKANDLNEKKKHSKEKGRHIARYCLILASALGELSGAHELPAEDKDKGIKKVMLISEYEAELQRYEKHSISPAAIVSEIRTKFEEILGFETKNLTNDYKKQVYYTVLNKYNAYHKYLKVKLGDSPELAGLEALCKRVQADSSKYTKDLRRDRDRDAAQGASTGTHVDTGEGSDDSDEIKGKHFNIFDPDNW